MTAVIGGIKKEPGGGAGGDKRSDKDGGRDDRADFPRPPLKPKRGGTKAYYALYVNGEHIRVHYLRDDGADWPGELRPGNAVAWVEEKPRNIHFFYFRLGNPY